MADQKFTYTDVENRLFAEIAYLDLDAVYQKYQDIYDGKVPLDIILSEDPDIRDELRECGLTDEQMTNWKISGIRDTNDSTGFYGCIIETEPGKAAVAFRGSGDMFDSCSFLYDWARGDVDLAYETQTNQHREVEAFLNENAGMLKQYDSLTMVGHSLGGNLADYGTIVSNKYGLSDRIERSVNMDGPGFNNEFMEMHADQIEKMKGKMYHYQWSIVGSLLNMPCDGKNIKHLGVKEDVRIPKGGDIGLELTRHDRSSPVPDENGNYIEETTYDSKKIWDRWHGVSLKLVNQLEGHELRQDTVKLLLSIVGLFIWGKDTYLGVKKKIVKYIEGIHDNINFMFGKKTGKYAYEQIAKNAAAEASKYDTFQIEPYAMINLSDMGAEAVHGLENVMSGIQKVQSYVKQHVDTPHDTEELRAEKRKLRQMLNNMDSAVTDLEASLYIVKEIRKYLSQTGADFAAVEHGAESRIGNWRSNL